MVATTYSSEERIPQMSNILLEETFPENPVESEIVVFIITSYFESIITKN
jgi:hypothetical protein